MEWVTTTTILEDLRGFGNRPAWDRFVGRFHRPIAAFVREVGVPDPDAEDVAQNTLLAFAEAYREGRYDRERGRLSRWLFGIAYRQALRHLRRSARAPLAAEPPEADGPGRPADESAAADVWDRIWDGHLLRTAIDRARREFAPRTFRAFELVVLEDAAPAAAAETLGAPVKAVYNAKHRVLHRVRELIRELDDPGRGDSGREEPGEERDGLS